MPFNPRAIVAATLLAFYSTIASAAPNIHEGLWEITTTVQVKGLPIHLPVEPQYQTQCLTRAEIEHPENISPPQVNCSIHDVNVSGDRVQWQMQCSGPFTAQGTGETIYIGDTFSGTATLVSHSGDISVEVSTIYQGKRVGDCK